MKKNTLIGGAALSIAAAAAIFGLMDRTQAANLSENNRNRVNSTVASSTNRFKELKQIKPNQIAPTQAEIDAHRAEVTKNMTAIEAALKAGDYNAWVTAMGTNNPWANKITKDNFPKFVQAYNLHQQANQIMTELGITTGPGVGLGLGMMGGIGNGLGNSGMHRGENRGRHLGWENNQDTSADD
jgi:hypothetical protein